MRNQGRQHWAKEESDTLRCHELVEHAHCCILVSYLSTPAQAILGQEVYRNLHWPTTHRVPRVIVPSGRGVFNIVHS